MKAPPASARGGRSRGKNLLHAFADSDPILATITAFNGLAVSFVGGNGYSGFVRVVGSSSTSSRFTPSGPSTAFGAERRRHEGYRVLPKEFD
jgi:hypothetical protein